MKNPILGIAAIALVGLAACTRAPETATQTKEDLNAVPPAAVAPVAPAPVATTPVPAPVPVVPTPPPAPARVVVPKPAAPPAPRNVTIASGTAVKIRTTTQLSTKTATPGERFSANLETPLSANGKVIAPKGAEVEGVVVNSDDGGRVKGLASLSLTVDRIDIAGKTVPVETSTFVQQARTTKKKDALKVGIGAGIGAAIGAIAGGGRGAAIGAASGGGAGTAVVLATKGEPAVVPAETVLTVRLTAPLTVRAN